MTSNPFDSIRLTEGTSYFYTPSNYEVAFGVAPRELPSEDFWVHRAVSLQGNHCMVFRKYYCDTLARLRETLNGG